MFAPDMLVAQRAGNLIVAAYALLDGQILFTDEVTALPVDTEELNTLPEFARYRKSQFATTSYLAKAAAIAAKISHRRAQTYALLKYFQSLKTASVPWIETHPHYGKKFSVEKDPYSHVLFAQAITAAYSCLEELGLEPRGSEKNPTFLPNQDWNPKVRENLEARLSAQGVDVGQDFPWLVRGAPTRIELRGRRLVGQKSSWSQFEVRDRDIQLIEAIARARWLRSRVSARKLSNLTGSLTIYDVLNVQNLARRLILEAAGEWPRDTTAA